jgi:hypothetical protein
MTFAMGLYAYAVVRWWRTGRTRHLVQALVGIVLAGLIRTWLAAIMIGSLVVLLYAIARGLRTRILITIAIVAIVRATLPFIMQMCALQAEQDLTEQVASIAGGFHGGGSAGVAFALYGPMDLITNAPLGMFSALFRPLPGDVLNPFGLLASAESVVILGFLLRALMPSRLRDSWRELRNDPLIGWALAMVLLWALIYAFVSSQNFGTAVRYRVQILPMLLGLLLYLGRARPRRLPIQLASGHA